ncbi:hypothetical protein KAR29_01460 [Aminithiophilus ramosus]|uniref:Uncharacterized protein n=1 Tax=Aminithiophilus ramosus TaxID=3029084 RepID=A0A9Q7ANQ3_9BACT|nr:hypothetical protein [Aminithiophilus ramosus]QTX32638.1 hypothetical protein KAR29_01460 [Aminithiophilus ramosus]
MKEERHVDLILENLLRDVTSLKDFDEEKEPLAPPCPSTAPSASTSRKTE